jgi:hypothetical protein
MVTEYADRLTGAGNAMMGQSDNQAKTRATASGTMFLAQQGYKLYESISKNIEEGYGEIGLMIVYQLVSNAERAIQSILPLAPLEDQELLREVLQMNVEDIPSRFNFTIQVTEVDKTEEAKLQKAMTMQQLYGAYTETVMNLAERIQMIKQMAPEMLEPAMKLYVGQTKIMEEIIDLLSDKNPEEFTVYVKDIDLLLRKDEMAKDQQVQQMKGALNASQQGQVPTQMPGGGAGAVGNPNVPTTVPNVPQGAGGEEAGGMVEPVS